MNPAPAPSQPPQRTAVGPRDWDRIVKDSNGTMFFLPDSLKEQAEKWGKMRQNLFKLANEMAQVENETSLIFTQLIYAVREEFAKRGQVEKVWTLDIGFNTEAMREGKFILSFTENQALK